jgi:hypothetical protein
VREPIFITHHSLNVERARAYTHSALPLALTPLTILIAISAFTTLSAFNVVRGRKAQRLEPIVRLRGSLAVAIQVGNLLA